MLGILTSLKRFRPSTRKPKIAKIIYTALCLFLFLGLQANAAELTTPDPQYLPGELAIIDGSIFWANESVSLRVTQLDGTALSGSGSDPWYVDASGSGDFTTYWSVEWEYSGDTLLVTGTGQHSGESATTSFICPNRSLHQLQNGDFDSAPEWANGNINGNNSCYSEGRSVPYRYFVKELNAGTSHYITIEMDWTKNLVHALDYMTSYDATESAPITLAGGPCGTISTSPPPGCSAPTVSFAFPDFLNTLNYSGSIPSDFFTTVNPGFVLDGPRNIEAFNVTIDSIGKYSFGGTASSRSFLVDVHFTVDTTGSIGFFWAGHLAEGNASSWFAGNGSASVSGAPYHSAVTLDGGGGAANRSIQNGVICLPPLVDIISDSSSVCDNSGYIYSGRDTSSISNLWDWTVVNGAIVGPNNLDSVVFTVNSGLIPGDFVYLIVESCDSTSGCPGESCCTIDTLAIPVISCNNPPIAICQDPTVNADANCQGAAIIDNGSYDPDGDPVTIVENPPGPYSLGQTVVTLIITDSFGAADTCTGTVTVVDITPPVATCPTDITVGNDPGQCGAVVNFASTVTDNCSATITCVPASGSFFPVGTTLVTCTATDVSGNTAVCTFNITVNDTEDPVATCPTDITVGNDPGQCGAVVNFSSTVTDNCSATIACVPASGSIFPVGTTQVICTATDPSGNTATCTFNITVNDTEDPVATCPADITVGNDPGLCGAVVNFSSTVTDNCTATISCVPASGSFFPVGTTLVTCTATDASGNTSSCTFNITVNDTEDPVATCPTDITVGNDPGQCGAVVNFSSTVTDNCSATISCVPPSGSIFPVGTTLVTCTATDASGNTSSCTFNITVNDTEDPVAQCPGDISTNTDASGCGATVTFTSTTTDNCTATISCVPVSGSFFPVGTTLVTCTATDASGNTDVCTFNVTVTNTPPTASCPGNETLFVCDLSPITIPGFVCADADNNLVSCTVDNGSLSGSDVTFNPLPGTNVINLTATDACGATAACQTVYTIVLNQMPWLTLPQDDNQFLCTNTELCYTLSFGDPDYPANHSAPTAYLLSGPGSITGDQLCFTPVDGVDDTYKFVVQVCDSCGSPSGPEAPSPPNSCVIDSFYVTVSFNDPPVASCPSNQTLDYMCGPSGASVCIPGFSASDPDNNIKEVTVDLGTYDSNTGEVCFTADTTGLYVITFTVTDSCDVTVDCTTEITINDPNLPPTATCPGPFTIDTCSLMDVTIAGFICDDPNGNLVSCTVDNGTLVGNLVTFTPVEGLNTITLTATDACGLTANCQTEITFNLPPPLVISDTLRAFAVCGPSDVCVDLPTVSGGLPPYVWRYNGDVKTDTVCVHVDDDIVLDLYLEVTDACGTTANTHLIIDATVNTAPVATANPPASVFLCEAGDSIIVPITIVDPDNGLTVTSQLGFFDYTDSTVHFAANTAGTYLDSVFVSDSCDLVDTVVYTVIVEINSPPQCANIGDKYYFQCNPTEVCVAVSASDVDGNFKECVVQSGPGSVVNGQWCYTPTGDEVSLVTIRCVDSCDAFCVTMFNVEFEVNEAPQANCPADTVIYTTTLPSSFTRSGFSCYDSDGNLTSCAVDVGTLVGTQVTFTPVWGINTITLTATDGCGLSDACASQIIFTRDVLCPVVKIEKTHGTLQGHFEDVIITTENSTSMFGGFEFLIAYDASALTFTEAEPGQLLEDCDWEYFTYRYGAFGNCGDACPSGLLRIIALAETNDGPIHPSCYGPPDTDPYELVTMRFLITNDRTFECQYVPIRFFWGDCNDNAFSSIPGDTLYIDRIIYDFEGNLIWDEDDDILFPENNRIPWVGAPDYCMVGDKEFPVRCIEFWNGGVDIICADSIDDVGDINMNGISNEVADAVMLTNYFVQGLNAFVDHVEASIAASDINRDGASLSVADLVYLVRIIIGDALPYAKPVPNGSLAITTQISDGSLNVEYEATIDVGAILLVFEVDGVVGSPTAGVGADRMDISSSFDGQELRVLLFNIGTESIPAGNDLLVSIPIEGTARLIDIEASDYFGSSLMSTTRSVPSKFVLDQNYPNPFNPTTTIRMNLPTTSDWRIAVYNIAGQLVREYGGRSEAGAVEVIWDGSDINGNRVASGIYLYKATADSFTETRKMILMK